MELLRQHRTIASADLSGPFAPVLQFQKREIHTVFPRFRNFELAQNLSLSFLVELCGVALQFNELGSDTERVRAVAIITQLAHELSAATGGHALSMVTRRKFVQTGVGPAVQGHGDQTQGGPEQHERRADLTQQVSRLVPVVPDLVVPVYQ